MSNEKNLRCLGYVGDETGYVGIKCAIIRIPTKQPVFHGKYPRFFSWLKSLFLSVVLMDSSSLFTFNFRWMDKIEKEKPTIFFVCFQKTVGKPRKKRRVLEVFVPYGCVKFSGDGDLRPCLQAPWQCCLGSKKSRMTKGGRAGGSWAFGVGGPPRNKGLIWVVGSELVVSWV